MVSRVLASGLTLALILSVTQVQAQTVYWDTTGIDNVLRPVRIQALTVNGIGYIVTISYGVNAQTDPHPVGLLPNADITDATDALTVLLNAQNPDDANLTLIYFQPNDDPRPPGGWTQAGLVRDVAGGDGNWNVWDDGFGNPVVLHTNNPKDDYWMGYAQFAVPEPGSFMLAGMLAGVSGLYYRRRKAKGHQAST